MIRTKQIAPGAANTVLVTNGAGMAIVMALLVNANVDAAAAIAGTKIDPNFGIQNVSTSGTLGAGAGTLTSLTISALTTGIAHVGVAGAITSSLIVNADVDAAAAIAGSKVTPNFGAQALTAGTGSFGGDVNFNGHKGTSIANGTAASDVAAFGQIPLIASVLPLQDAIDAVIGSAGQYADQNHVHPLRTPASTFSYYEDWATGVATAGGSYGWANTPTGAGAATALTLTALDATHIGIVQLGTGTTATGKATIQNYVGTGGCLFTQSTVSETVHEWWVQLPALSTAAEEYAFRTGIMDGSAAGDAANGIYFEYLRTTDTHWRIATAKASTRTKTNSTVTVTAGAWYRLTWQKAEGAASYDFYINGVFVASIATNIPTALTGPTAKLEKSATTGNVASLAYIDVAAHVETFSVPRAA